MLQDLANFESRADLDDKAKVALRFAEHMTLDSNNVDEALWTQLRQHFDEGEVVELASAIGLFQYFNKFNNALRMEPTK